MRGDFTVLVASAMNVGVTLTSYSGIGLWNIAANESAWCVLEPRVTNIAIQTSPTGVLYARTGAAR